MDSSDTTQGKTIMIDGPDGVGKTTQLKRIVSALEESGRKVYSTRIMGGTPIGEELRKVIFMDHSRPAVTNLYIAEAIYYALADDLTRRRRANPHEIILVDRSPLTMIAYQAHGDQADAELCHQACRVTLEALAPDLVIVYQADQSILDQRRSQRNPSENSDYFEQQQDDYFARVAEGYKSAAETYGAQTVDASGSSEDLHQKTMQLIEKVLAR